MTGVQTCALPIFEINPRTSRSSALASKATGFPIALVSAKLACGLTLDEIPYWRDGTLEKYTPSGDYVVVKFARWAFEKFRGAEDRLGTQMKAVGEAMAIGKTYKEAFQKAIRSLEIGRYGLGFAKDFHERPLAELLDMLKWPTSERQFIIYEALRKGAKVDDISEITSIKGWFIQEMKELVLLEEEILAYRGKGGELPEGLLARAKMDGFADRYLAKLLDLSEAEIRSRRKALGIVQGWHPVPVSGVDDATYYYSSYHGTDATKTTDRRKVMVLGGGPNRIGQGIEFDYCCVHAAFALRDLGYETIMINCNPETVSTDYDTSDRLYFEPLTVEDVLSIYEKERPEGMIVQFGGQTPLNIARELEEAGVRIFGTTVDAIDLAEDRDRFRMMMDKMNVPMPESGMASNLGEALEVAARIGYPLMVRPSYVLGGRGMEVIYDEEMLERYVAAAVDVTPERPILIDRFLENALEAEADALSDGTSTFVPAVMEHIEQAGVHSGDSACVIPPVTIPKRQIETIKEYTCKIAKELGVVGLMNMQYAIAKDVVYVLEANPRSSRTIPFVSKTVGLPLAKIAAGVMAGKSLAELGYTREPAISYVSVKEVLLPFEKLPGADTLLGPEMRSTGEVMGIDYIPGLAFFKAELSADNPLPTEGVVFISVRDEDKGAIAEVARKLSDSGLSIIATAGTAEFLTKMGVAVKEVEKIYVGSPNVLDYMKRGDVSLIINTPTTKQSVKDGFQIRRNAVDYHVPYITTVQAARAAAQAIEIAKGGEITIKPLDEYHREVR